jgi:hypothetical protein
MAASDTAARMSPYIDELFENSSARENLRDAYRHARRRRRKAAGGRRLVLLVGLGVAAAGIALAAEEELRTSLTRGTRPR